MLHAAVQNLLVEWRLVKLSDMMEWLTGLLRYCVLSVTVSVMLSVSVSIAFPTSSNFKLVVRQRRMSSKTARVNSLQASSW